MVVCLKKHTRTCITLVKNNTELSPPQPLQEKEMMLGFFGIEMNVHRLKWWKYGDYSNKTGYEMYTSLSMYTFDVCYSRQTLCYHVEGFFFSISFHLFYTVVVSKQVKQVIKSFK